MFQDYSDRFVAEVTVSVFLLRLCNWNEQGQMRGIKIERKRRK